MKEGFAIGGLLLMISLPFIWLHGYIMDADGVDEVTAALWVFGIVIVPPALFYALRTDLLRTEYDPIRIMAIMGLGLMIILGIPMFYIGAAIWNVERTFEHLIAMCVYMTPAAFIILGALDHGGFFKWGQATFSEVEDPTPQADPAPTIPPPADTPDWLQFDPNRFK